MRRRPARAALLAAAALAAACGRDGQVRPPSPSPGGAPRSAAPKPDLAKLDETFRAFLAREGVRAAHVTVLRRGEALFEKGYGAVRDGEGPPTSRSVFPVGSISKQFTAAAVLALVDEGLVRLDAPVRDHLPEWFANDPDLRVSHLLTHTSGLADFLWLDGYRALGERPETPKSAYLALAASAPRRFAPGERWAYSNTNYKALAILAERVAGRPFDEVLAERVFRPAGLEGIGPCHDLPPGGLVDGFAPSGRLAPLDASRAAYEGDGGLCATPAALAQWLRKGLAGRDGTPPVLRRLASPARLSSGETVPYGYGVSTRELLGHPMIWHGGNVDGHSALLAYAPHDDLGIVVLTNRGFLWLTELLPPWIGEPPPARAPAGAPPPIGRFEDGLFRYEIAADGDELRVEIDLIGPLVFVPAGERRWVARDHPASFLLRLPSDGSVDAFEVDWGEVRSFARRVGDGR